MQIVFINYKNQKITLSNNAHEHIAEIHPEITLDLIQSTLKDPDEVRSSSYKENTELYYLLRTKRRFICVVVKTCSDGNFISTALTTEKPKVGKIIYAKEK